MYQKKGETLLFLIAMAFFFLLFILFLIDVPLAYGAPATSTSCGDVRTNLALTSNVSANAVTHSSPGTCFIINGSNLILNGAGFSVVGNTTGVGINMTIANGTNITLTNFGLIHNFTYGIFARNMSRSKIINNTIRNNTLDGIWLENSSYNIISNNTILNNSQNGIVINFSVNNNFTNNTLQANLGSGFFIANSTNNFLLNNSVLFNRGTAFNLRSSIQNLFYNNTIFPNGASDAFTIDEGSIYNKFEYNNLSEFDYGFRIIGGDNNNFTFNTLTSTRASTRGFDLSAEVDLTNISYNEIKLSGSECRLISITGSVSLFIFRNGLDGGNRCIEGIELIGTNYSLISFNNISSTDSVGFGIKLLLDNSFNNITFNNINTTENTAIALQVGGRYQNTFSFNNITTMGDEAIGIDLVAANNSIFESNTIFTRGEIANGIRLESNSNNNTFTNNNLTSANALIIFEILMTVPTHVNYFIYNNTFGEIRWINNGTGSFLNNLSINITNDQGFGLNRNLFISNNTIAFNTSAFGTTPRINSSANLTLRGLTFRDFDQMRRVQNYTTSAAQIRTAGINCDEDTCQNLSYDATNGILIFNTTTFSSFSMHDGTNPLVVNFWMNATNGSNFSSSLVNKLIFNATVNDTHSIVDSVLFGFSNANGTSFNFTGTVNFTLYSTELDTSSVTDGFYTVQIYANDTSSNLNNTVSNISFTLDRVPPNITYLFVNVTNQSGYTTNFTRGGVIRINATVNDTTTSVTNVTFGIRSANSTNTEFNLTPNTQFDLATNRTDWVWFTDLPLSTVRDGIYYVMVYANDTLNNFNGSNANFTAFLVDQTPPNITYLFVNVTNQSGYTTNFTRGGVIRINATVNDTTTYVRNVTFGIRSANSTNTEFNITSNRTDWVWFTDLPLSTVRDGIYYVMVYANDTLNNFNGSAGSYSNFTAFVVDGTPPNVSNFWMNVTNGFTFSNASGTIQFNGTINDSTTSVQTVIFGFSNSANASQFNVTSVKNESGGIYHHLLQLNTLSCGTYTARTYANDTLGNLNNSVANLTFTITCAEGSPGGGNPSGFPASSSSPAAPAAPVPPAPAAPAETPAPVSTPTQPISISATLSTQVSGDSTSSLQIDTIVVTITNNGNIELVLSPAIAEALSPLPLEEKYKNILRLDLSRKKVPIEQQEQEIQEQLETLRHLEKQKANYLFGKAFSFGLIFPKQDYSISGITYSKDRIIGRLLRSELLDFEDIIIPPRQTITKEITVRRGLSITPTPITLTFLSQEKTLSTTELSGAGPVIGGAVDVNAPENVFEVYFLIPSSLKSDIDIYTFEFAIDEAGPSSRLHRFDHKYSESFGPYAVKTEEGFLFIQQFTYDKTRYQGEHIFTMKLYREGSMVTQQQYTLTLG